jgi:alpha-beta hydrolase superfamily lysophospholipase
MSFTKSKYRKIKIYSKNQNDIKDYSSGFYYSLFKNLVEVDYKICPETPLLILSSGQDINGIHCRLAKTLYNAYSIYDLHKITLIIYPDAQHDLLFGLEKNKVQNDILDFINKHV